MKLCGRIDLHIRQGCSKGFENLSSQKHRFITEEVVVNCLNFRKLKLKFELKWNFDFFKIEISDLKKNQVALNIPIIQNKSTGGMAVRTISSKK